MRKYSKKLSLINKYFKALSSQKNSDGFTLIELLVAASITTIVVGLTGFGVVAITQKNKEAKIETERRVELNRALDFIADEVRQAKPIATNASANLTTVAQDFDSSFSTGTPSVTITRTPVLTLQIPGVSQRVIYYIAPKSPNSVWLGSNIIYRWGPNFNDNGTYSNPTSPSSWTYEPLADLIDNTALSSNPCGSWFLNPPLASAKGFYACVDPNGRIADIYLQGEIRDAYSNSQDTLKVNTKAFARPYTPTFTTSGGSGGGTSNGTITFTQPSTAYFEVLGGDIRCGTGGDVIDTTTTINVTAPAGTTSTPTTVPSSNKALNLSASVGSKVTVTGAALAGYCTQANGREMYFGGSLYNSSTHNYDTAASGSKQVMTLRNGDAPPLFAPYGNQPPIDTFLTKYIDPATGKVKLAENQVIFLFELGATSGSAYDMQDLVVLATITPKAQ